MADEVTFDLEPYIRDAIAKMQLEIDKRSEAKVADVLRERGWTVVPPAPIEAGEHDCSWACGVDKHGTDEHAAPAPIEADAGGRRRKATRGDVVLYGVGVVDQRNGPWNLVFRVDGIPAPVVLNTGEWKIDWADAEAAPAEAGEREALAYLITAHRMRERGLSGPITDDLIEVARPMARFLVREGFRRVPEASDGEREAREMLEEAISAHIEAEGRTEIEETANTLYERLDSYRDAIRRAPIEDAEPVAYAVYWKANDGLAGVFSAEQWEENPRYRSVPLYPHPAAPIEVTDEMLLAALNEHYGEDFDGLDGWSEESQINMRAAIEAAFKEMS